MKKTLLSFVICVLLFNANLSAQWIKTNGPYGGNVNTLAKVGNNMWAGVHTGIYTSADEGATWTKSPFWEGENVQLLYSSGDTIITVYDSIIGTSNANTTACVSVASFDAGNTWSSPWPIGIAHMPPILLHHVQDALVVSYRLVSYDFGLSWDTLSGAWGDEEIYSSAFNHNIGIVTSYNYYSHYYKVYISNDGLHNWQLIDSSLNYNKGASLTSNNVLYLGDSTSVLRSTDNGLSFQTVFTFSNPYAAVRITERGAGLYLELFSDSITTYQSQDNGLTWIGIAAALEEYHQPIPLLNGDTLALKLGGDAGVLIVRHLAGQGTCVPSSTGIASNNIYSIHSNNNVLFAATSYNLARSADGGNTWTVTQEQMGSIREMQFFGDTAFAVSTDTLYRSFDNGLTWQALLPYNMPICFSIAKANSRLYVSIATIGVVYTDDYGNTWHKTASTLQDGGELEMLNGVLYCIISHGQLYKYDVAGNAWLVIASYPYSGRYLINSLSAVGNMLIGYSYEGIAITMDAGVTWSESPLNGIPRDTIVQSITEPVFIPQYIFEHEGLWFADCGGQGVYRSEDQGMSWLPLENGPVPFIAGGGFTVVNNILYAASTWHSVWKRAAPFNAISGQVYLDANNNGIKDAAEQPLQTAIMYTQIMGHTATTDALGHYSLVTDAIGDTMRVALPNTFFSSTPGYYITAGADTGKNYALYAPPSIVDVSVELTNTTVFRPGFNTNLVLEVRNNAMNTQTPSLIVVLDSNVQFTSATPSPTSINGDTLLWQLGAMSFGDNSIITVSATTLIAAALGTTVTVYAAISPIVDDTIPENNTSVLTDTIVGSYDPNDKQCSLGNKISPQQIQEEEEVVFTVRFQNTGNYQADFVRISDTVSRFFDLSTFKVLSSSHSMHWSMQGLGIVNFYFDSILLPAMTDDEPGSHGFVKYSLRCKQSALVGDAITNTAFIYFDFNAPIVTNTTTTVVTVPFVATDIQEVVFAEDLAIRVYPNPTSKILYLDLSELGVSEKQISIYSVTGELVYASITKETLSTLHLNEIGSGMYYGVVNSNGNMGKFKFVVQH